MALQPTVPLHLIGGNGGSPHEVRGWEEGKRVRKIRVYVGDWLIKAIRIWLTGDEEGNYRQFGQQSGHQWREFTFEDDERVERMSLWGNGEGSRAGAIMFSTNKGRNFDYGMTRWGRKTEYEINVGSGILVGAVFNAGVDIDAQGYYFLSSSVFSNELRSVRYGSLRGPITSVALDTYAQTNRTRNPIAWRFSGAEVVRTSNQWTSSTQSAFKLNASIAAAVPEIVKAGVSFEWQMSNQSSHQRLEERERCLTWENQGELKPGESISLKALISKGTMSVPYTGTATVTLANGATFSFQESGTFTGVVCTSARVVNA